MDPNGARQQIWRIHGDHGPGPDLADRDLVPLAPAMFNDFACPNCAAPRPAPSRSLFIGIQVLGDYRCSACGARYLRDLPIGFQTEVQLAFDPDTRRILHWNAEPWITYPEYAAPTTHRFPMERRVLRRCGKIILLNTLDHLYGHVLLKLLNAQHYLDHYPDHGLVVLVPRMFAWLVPDGVAEVWLVDQKLSQARAWHPCIDAFVQELLPAYQEVSLARGWSHPDHTRINIERFSRVQPFPLAEFTTRPPHVTIVARTDRLWFSSPWSKLLYRALNPLRLRNSLGGLFVHRQNAMIARTIRLIRRELPEVTFSVVGLGAPGGLRGLAEDLRTTRMDLDTELRWCRTYARSQVVVGVHGSNMLLPTAHAAGLVEILPHDRLGNIVQDVCVRENDRMQLFLYRFVDEFARPGDVARQVTSMFRYFTLYHRDNRLNVLRA